MRAGIALGSNLGDRHALLNQAVGHLQSLHELSHGDFFISAYHETEPVNCMLGTPPFLNAVGEIGTSLPPLELLHRLQQEEIRSGRPRKHERNTSRTLDLDLLYCDDMTLHHPELELPHPRMIDRSFVMTPLAEIRPELRLPGWEMTCLEYALKMRKK